MVQTRAQCRKKIIKEKWDKVESAQGVFIDILSRLSVQSIRSFKTVSKYWNESMSNRHFAKLQITQSKVHPSFIAYPSMGETMELYLLKPENFRLVNLRTIDPSDGSDEGQMYLISSFNGLICYVNRICDKDIGNQLWDLQIWICNPCTGETLLLPQGRPSFEFVPIVGVAYGSDITEYKVFRIFCAGKKHPEERVYEGFYIQDRQIVRTYSYAVVYECEVFSSKSGSWENIGILPCVPMYSHDSPCRYGSIFVGGKIFWLSSLEGPGKILSVDLEGRFDVMNLPHFPDDLNEEDNITDHTYLINLQGSLSVVFRYEDYMDIWAWKSDGEKYSWVLVCEDTTPFDDCDDLVVAMTSSKNLILCMTETHWFSYDVVTKKWNKKRAKKFPKFENISVLPFTESILPCNGGVIL